jgi:adhesin transport system membrane fusion protein
MTAMDAVTSSRFRVRSPLLWLQVGCVAAFLVWAAMFDLDVASHADGQVIPAGQIKRVQHLEGGIVRAIKVAEGQRVRQGEVIAELEGVASTADLGELRSRAASLEGKTLRLNAILAKANSLALPAELQKSQPSVAADARSAFMAYRERYSAVLRTHESKIAQREAEIREAHERLLGLQSRSRLIAEQVRISEQMLSQKLTNEYEHLQLRKEQAAIDADRDSTLAAQQRLATAREESIAALAAFRSEEDVLLRRELLESSTELGALRERLRKPSDSVERMAVRAPVAGTVMSLLVKNSGAVVAPGGVVATLVPEDETLVAEVRLPIADVGFVREGAPARVNLAGGSGGFSTIDAKVQQISPDAAMDEKTGSGFYVVRLKLEQFAFQRGGHAYPLRPGVRVMATISTGSRSVLLTLTDSFFGNGMKPLSEL